MLAKPQLAISLKKKDLKKLSPISSEVEGSFGRLFSEENFTSSSNFHSSKEIGKMRQLAKVYVNKLNEIKNELRTVYNNYCFH